MFPGCKHILCLDFETFYTKDYELRTMTTPEYIWDPRFEMICCSVTDNAGPPVLVDGPDFGRFIAQYRPEECATVTFNSLFDNSILAWRYGWVPRFMLDSMNMARALEGHKLPRLNLETVCTHFNILHDKSIIKTVKGLHRADIIAQGLWPAFTDYCNRDNTASREIFHRLIRRFPQQERVLMDLVIRCAVQPSMRFDVPTLEEHLKDLRAEKCRLLRQVGVDLNEDDTPEVMKAKVKASRIRSAAGFTELLENLGVEIQYKKNKKGEDVPCFAKTDEFMAALQEHEDPMVQALAAARLEVASTIEESRAEKMRRIGGLQWPSDLGSAPIAMRFCGAHTWRLSGEWGLNMQNLPAGRAGKTNKLRKAIKALPGEVVVAGDLAQIEARLVAWLAKCSPLLNEFGRPGGDPYSAFARIIFGIPEINRKFKDPVTGKKPWEVHGFIGKTGVLGLGYMCGKKKFYWMVKTGARLAGIDIDAILPWNIGLSEKTVNQFRAYPGICALWQQCEYALELCWAVPGGPECRIGPVTVRYGEVEGPGGIKMVYKNPYKKDGEFYYSYGRKKDVKLYAGAFLENIVQFLARIIIMNAAIRLWLKYGLQFRLQAHDELVFTVKKYLEEWTKQVLRYELTQVPTWAPGLPLGCDVASGDSYGDAK